MQGAQSEPVALAFDGVLVIVGGASFDPGVLRALNARCARLIGADGGADRIVAAGLEPEYVIGDMDSVTDPARWERDGRLIRLAEQETTDFEKALYSTSAPVTVGLGMTGGRFDHTLAALDALARHAVGRVVILVDETDVAVALTGPFAFEVAPGERVSVHPLAPITFRRSEGLAYPLAGIRLAPGVRTGTSNSATAGPFEVVPEPDSPPWLLILDARHLDAVIDASKSG